MYKKNAEEEDTKNGKVTMKEKLRQAYTERRWNTISQRIGSSS
jgi:hypothetical protein